MGSVTRLFPEPKLRALLDFKTAFPQEFATLEIFVDLAKEEPDFQASFCDVNSKIIFMSILDIMDKERMSLQVMYDNMKGSRAPEVSQFEKKNIL